MSNRFTSRLSDDDDFKRDELIRKIEHSVEQMTLSELEALSYDMFTKVNIRKDGKLLKSIKSLNAYFEEAKLNYYILAKRTNSKRYWIIIKDVDK